ncbi:hypothetical protein D3C87_1583640 [compost metagenome]
MPEEPLELLLPEQLLLWLQYVLLEELQVPLLLLSLLLQEPELLQQELEPAQGPLFSSQQLEPSVLLLRPQLRVLRQLSF